MTSTADVVVVGAGVIGCSIAAELAKAGHAVVVVDRAAGPGQGSTSASSAIIRFNYSTWDGVATSWEAQHRWLAWREHLEAPRDEVVARFHRVGMVFLDVDLAPSSAVLPLFERAGIPYEHWDAEQLSRRGLDPRRYWPPRALDDERFWDTPTSTLGALFTPDAGFVDDPGLAAGNLADAARRRGARFVFGVAVTEVLGDGVVTGVRLEDGTTVSAPVVVNAAGPWSGCLNALAGVGGDWTVSVRPLRQEVHQVPAPAGYNPAGGVGPVVADLDQGVYFRGTPGDGLLVGGTEPACDPLHWVDDPDAADLGATQQLFDANITRAARRLPELGVPGRPSGIAGIYDVTEDWAPVYDTTERPGFLVAIGTSGNQFKNAPVVGELLHAVLRGDKTVVGSHTGLEISLSAFGRKRERNAASSGTVMG